MSTQTTIERGVKWTILVVFGLVMVFPFYWLIRSSFMTQREIFTIPMVWVPDTFRFENYLEVFRRLPFARYLFNSTYVVVLNVVGIVLSSSLVAFGFARINFPGRDFIFVLVLATMLLPSTVLLIPQFILWRTLGAFNTYWPLIAPAFLSNAFNVFLFRQFFMTIPRELDQAAFVDGATYVQVYRLIILPLSIPAITTVAVFHLFYTWNDLIGPLIYLQSPEKWTVALGLQHFQGQYDSDWHLLMAATTVTIVPMIILFMIAQKTFMDGISVSPGVKG